MILPDKLPAKVLLLLAICFLALPLFSQTMSPDDSFRAQLGEYSLDILPLTGSFALSNQGGVILKQNSEYGSFFRRIVDDELQIFQESVRSVRVFTSEQEASILYTFTDGDEALLLFRLNQAVLAIEFSATAKPSANVKYQLLLDTVTGETGPNHFTRSGSGINREFTEELAPASEALLVSSSGADGSQLAIAVKGYKGRLRVSAANIRRLGEAVQGFRANSNRNFNLLPFSINDSGLLFETEPEPGLENDMSIAFQVLLSFGKDARVLPASSAPAAVERSRGQLFTNPRARAATASESAGSSATNGSFSEAQPETATIDPQLRAKFEQLASLNELLAKIDELLAQDNPSPEELAVLRQLFDALIRASNR